MSVKRFTEEYTKADIEKYGPVWEIGGIYHIIDTALEADYVVYAEENTDKITKVLYPVRTVTIKGETPVMLSDVWGLEMMVDIDTIKKIGYIKDHPEYLL